MSKRNLLFIVLVLIQLLGIIYTVARGQLHLSVLVWLAILAGSIALAFITSIVITDLLKKGLSR
jgi:hypothetical protein